MTLNENLSLSVCVWVFGCNRRQCIGQCVGHGWGNMVWMFKRELYFPLVSVFNPDSFSGRNSTRCLSLGFLQTKSQLCFSVQFLPFKIKIKSQTLFLCFFKTCLTSRALSPHLKLASHSGFFLGFSNTWNRQANYSLCGSQGEIKQSRSCQLCTQGFMGNGQHEAGGPEADYTVVTWREAAEWSHKTHWTDGLDQSRYQP